MARESSVKDRAVKAIRQSGRWAMRLAASPFQKTGMPDILVILRSPPGRALFIEMKRPGQSPRQIQAFRLHELANAGAATAIATTVDEALAAVREAER